MKKLESDTIQTISQTTKTLQGVNHFLKMAPKERRSSLQNPSNLIQSPLSTLPLGPALSTLASASASLTPNLKQYLATTFFNQLAFICNDTEADLQSAAAANGRRLAAVQRKVNVLTARVAEGKSGGGLRREQGVRKEVGCQVGEGIGAGGGLGGKREVVCWEGVTVVVPVAVKQNSKSQESEIDCLLTESYREPRAVKKKIWISDDEESEGDPENPTEFCDPSYADRMNDAKDQVESAFEAILRVIGLIESLGKVINTAQNTEESKIKLDGKFAIVNFHFTKLNDLVFLLAKDISILKEEFTAHYSHQRT